MILNFIDKHRHPQKCELTLGHLFCKIYGFDPRTFGSSDAQDLVKMQLNAAHLAGKGHREVAEVLGIDNSADFLEPNFESIMSDRLNKLLEMSVENAIDFKTKRRRYGRELSEEQQVEFILPNALSLCIGTNQAVKNGEYQVKTIYLAELAKRELVYGTRNASPQRLFSLAVAFRLRHFAEQCPKTRTYVGPRKGWFPANGGTEERQVIGFRPGIQQYINSRISFFP